VDGMHIIKLPLVRDMPGLTIGAKKEMMG